MNFKDCEVVANDEKIGKDEYIKRICALLKEKGKNGKKYTLIAAVDLEDHANFPGNAHGNNLHWALIHGYYKNKETGEYYFQVIQYAQYYIWSADKLYQSNKQIPVDLIPGLLEDISKKYYTQCKAKVFDPIPPIPSDYKPSFNIRFGLFAVPVLDNSTTEKDISNDNFSSISVR
jgi:hypothetical protein